MSKKTRQYATGLLLALSLVFVCVTVLPGCPRRCSGPDPKAESIGYELLSMTSSRGGVVRITGVVTNYGQSPFLSAEGQQSALLFEGDQLVAQQDFTNLDVDEDVVVSFERTWSTVDEFRPPSYMLMVDYDPDIDIDGNPDNDDCNRNNNERTRSTSALDAFFDL